MIEVSLIRDVFRGTVHGAVLRNGSDVSFKALTAYGSRLVSSSRGVSSINDITLPDGVVMSGFKQVKTSAKSLISELFDSTNVNTTTTELVNTATKYYGYRFLNRHILSDQQTKSDAEGLPQLTPEAKSNYMNYKGRKFKNQIKVHSSIKSLGANFSRYNKYRNVFSMKSTTQLDAVGIENAISIIGTGQVRRAIGGIAAANKGLGFDDRRLERRVKSLLHAEDSEVLTDPERRIAESSKCLLARR
jgi:hypothetical protein